MEMAGGRGKPLLGSFAFSVPTNVVFGFDTVDSVGEKVKQLGRRALVVAAAKSMEKIGALGRVTRALEKAGVAVTVFQEVESDPTATAIDDVAHLCRKEGCSVVVGLGGGSAIDFAKGVAVAGTHEGTVIDYMTRVGYPPKPITGRTLPIAAVPTTAGTGAEVTEVAVITIPATHEKHGIINPLVIPRVAIVDPGLTLSLPARLTAGTGFDVFGHAFEAFASKFTTPFADMVALEAMRLVGGHLAAAVRERENAVAREHMSWASTLGGMAIANAGMTVAHGIAQALGGRFHIAHGEAVAFCLPEVMEQMVPSRADRLARVAEAMGISAKGGGAEGRARACVAGLKKLREEVGLDIRLSEFGIRAQDLDQLVEDVFNTQHWSVEHHPQELSHQDVKRILEARL
jgi:alcohol dehydrogenase class IV